LRAHALYIFPDTTHDIDLLTLKRPGLHEYSESRVLRFLYVFSSRFRVREL